jgi:Rrf2 family iron-sulfur cluster assembly transcriptional regulator
MMAQLDDITIADLCQRARAKGLDQPPTQPRAERVAI